MKRFSNAADGGWQSKVDLSATTMVVPFECIKHIGGCCHVKTLEDVYVELVLCEAYVEGMRLSNFVLIE